MSTLLELASKVAPAVPAKKWYESKKFIAGESVWIPSFLLIALAMLTHQDALVISNLISVLGGGALAVVALSVGFQGGADVRAMKALIAPATPTAMPPPV